MSQLPYRPDAPIAVCRDFFIKSKSICADPQDSSLRNLTLCGRRRATGKGKGERLCFIERKDKSFVSNCRDFRREMFLFFDLANGKTKIRGLFSTCPLFLSSLPLFLRAPSCYGGKSVAAFSLHSAFVPFPVPQVSAPSRMTPSHAGTRTRALRTQQVSLFCLHPSPATY